MEIYTSRFSNPQLNTGNYTAVRICVGAPRWRLPYTIAGEINALKPFGLFGQSKYDNDKDGFRREYFKLLQNSGVDSIARQLSAFERQGKSVVLLCYEDVRKGENDWCHRIMFAEWWQEQTGEVIEELYDPTTPKIVQPKKTAKMLVAAAVETSGPEQFTMFDL
jgi:hypothetical protein